MEPSSTRDLAHAKELQRRAAAFVDRAIPSELQPHYVPGSVAEIVITSCARGDTVDPELLQLAELAAQEYEDAIRQAHTRELKDYYGECQAILRAIVATHTPRR